MRMCFHRNLFLFGILFVLSSFKKPLLFWLEILGTLRLIGSKVGLIDLWGYKRPFQLGLSSEILGT